jgi:hypothetical protein
MRRTLFAFAFAVSACLVVTIAPIFFVLNTDGKKTSSDLGYASRRRQTSLSSSLKVTPRRGSFEKDDDDDDEVHHRYAISSKQTSLCDELLRVSANHTAVVELLTRQQYVAANHHHHRVEGELFQGDTESNVKALNRDDDDEADGDEHPAWVPPTECLRAKSNASTTTITPEKKRRRGVVVVDAFLFGGGEIDTLEMRLYELYPVVDKFIAVTSNATHKGEPTSGDALLTPLFQGGGKHSRLGKYADKFEIFRVDQRHVGDGDPDIRGVNFHYEGEKERAIAEELALRYPGDGSENKTAVVIFGHVDEIPARDDVWRIANCDEDLVKKLPGNFGIWFPYGNLEYAFRSDFPARGKPWTLGDPGVSLANRKDDIRLARGKFPNVLGRGFHATNYCFPPQVILKQLTATEYKGFDDVVARLRAWNSTTSIEEGNARRSACRAFMATIRDECLNAPRRVHFPNGRMRRVSDLSESSDSLSVFYKPLALRDGGFHRYPCWDPKGASVDLRAESLVVDVHDVRDVHDDAN